MRAREVGESILENLLKDRSKSAKMGKERVR